MQCVSTARQPGFAQLLQKTHCMRPAIGSMKNFSSRGKGELFPNATKMKGKKRKR